MVQILENIICEACKFCKCLYLVQQLFTFSSWFHIFFQFYLLLTCHKVWICTFLYTMLITWFLRFRFEWWLLAIPFSIAIFVYDECRKTILRRYKGCKYSWKCYVASLTMILSRHVLYTCDFLILAYVIQWIVIPFTLLIIIALYSLNKSKLFTVVNLLNK